jgi:hypothetical protein
MQEAQAEIDAHAVRAEALSRKSELDRAEVALHVERRRLLAEIGLTEGRAKAEASLVAAQAERESAEAKARVLMAENLPKLAAAVGQKFGEVKITQIGGAGANEGPFNSIAQAVAAVVELAKNSGV